MLATHRLMFAGQPVAGVTLEQLRKTLSERLKLTPEQAELMFSGQPLSVKKFTEMAQAETYRARFTEMGAQVWIEDIPPPAPVAAPKASPFPKISEEALSSPPAPARAAPPAPQAPPAPAQAATAPAPAAAPVATPAPLPPAAGLSLVEPAPAAGDEIVCPNCGERQPKRTLCRKCSVDMPRALEARKQAELEAREARQYETQQPNSRPSFLVDRDPVFLADDTPSFVGFSLDGRFGRGTYLLGNLALLAILLPIVVFSLKQQSIMLLIGLMLLYVYSSVRMTILRLNDLGWSRWLAAIMLVPTIGTLFGLALLVVPGERGENAHGRPTPITGFGVVGFCLVIFFGSLFSLGKDISDMATAMAAGEMPMSKKTKTAQARPAPKNTGGPVIVYSMRGCRECSSLRDELVKLNVPVEEVFLDKDRSAFNELKEKLQYADLGGGKLQLPLVEVHGEILPGYTTPMQIMIKFKSVD